VLYPRASISDESARLPSPPETERVVGASCMVRGVLSEILNIWRICWTSRFLDGATGMVNGAIAKILGAISPLSKATASCGDAGPITTKCDASSDHGQSRTVRRSQEIYSLATPGVCQMQFWSEVGMVACSSNERRSVQGMALKHRYGYRHVCTAALPGSWVFMATLECRPRHGWSHYSAGDGEVYTAQR
jgi:hypothetical protein